MTALLEVSGVSKHFGGLYALNGLDLHVNEHEIVSVIGPNGAGKSTVFNVITGLYTPDAGSVVFRGDRSWVAYQARSPSSASRGRSRT